MVLRQLRENKRRGGQQDRVMGSLRLACPHILSGGGPRASLAWPWPHGGVSKAFVQLSIPSTFTAHSSAVSSARHLQPR